MDDNKNFVAQSNPQAPQAQSEPQPVSEQAPQTSSAPIQPVPQQPRPQPVRPSTRKEEKPFTTFYWVMQTLTGVFLLLFVFAMIERGFFTSYIASYGVLFIGLIAAVVSLLRKQWKVALLDLIIGAGCFGLYLLLTFFVF